jgi:hypothetical protein
MEGTCGGVLQRGCDTCRRNTGCCRRWRQSAQLRLRKGNTAALALQMGRTDMSGSPLHLRQHDQTQISNPERHSPSSLHRTVGFSHWHGRLTTPSLWVTPTSPTIVEIRPRSKLLPSRQTQISNPERHSSSLHERRFQSSTWAPYGSEPLGVKEPDHPEIRPQSKLVPSRSGWVCQPSSRKARSGEVSGKEPKSSTTRSSVVRTRPSR